MSFDSLGLDAAVLKAVADQGYTEPTPIQAATIPVIIEGQDVIGGRPDRHRQDRRLHPAAAAPQLGRTKSRADQRQGPSR
jgi:hypothetical protein